MKSQITLCFFCLIILVGKAKSNVSAKDSVKIYKNEIGINLIPVFKMLSGPFYDNTFKYNIQYKRNIKGNFFIRLGISAITDKYRNYYSAPTVFGNSNGSLTVRYHGIKSKPLMEYKAGLEYKWGKKNVKFFTGVDLGLLNSRSTYTEYYGKRDSLTSSDPYSNYGELGYHDNKDSVVYSYVNKQNGILFSPFFGVQFHFSKKFFFSCQSGIQMAFIFGQHSNIVNNGNSQPGSYNYQSFDFDASALINNFSLCYRF